MEEQIQKAKRAIDWKIAGSVVIGLVGFGVAVFAVKKTGKLGRDIANIATGGK